MSPSPPFALCCSLSRCCSPLSLGTFDAVVILTGAARARDGDTASTATTAPLESTTGQWRHVGVFDRGGRPRAGLIYVRCRGQRSPNEASRPSWSRPSWRFCFRSCGRRSRRLECCPTTAAVRHHGEGPHRWITSPRSGSRPAFWQELVTSVLTAACARGDRGGRGFLAAYGSLAPRFDPAAWSRRGSSSRQPSGHGLRDSVERLMRRFHLLDTFVAVVLSEAAATALLLYSCSTRRRAAGA